MNTRPELVTDWKTIAIFLAGFIATERPSYALLIFQLIADNTTSGEAANTQELVI